MQVHPCTCSLSQHENAIPGQEAAKATNCFPYAGWFAGKATSLHELT